MKILKGLLFFFFMTVVGSMSAQDIHFTQFYLSPLTTNPAYTGAFNGTFRVGGIYRDQWGGVSSSAFRTPSFYIDAPVLMLGKRNWLGVGGMFLNDRAGKLGLGQSQAMGNVALHFALDAKSKSVLTFGIQAGYINRSIDLEGASFEDAIRSGNTSLDLENIMAGGETKLNSNKFDMSAGVLLKAQMNKKMRIELGATLKHILTPDLHLNEGSLPLPTTPPTPANPSQEGIDAYDVPGNFLMHGQFFVDVTEKVVIKPAFLFQATSGANEVFVQGLAGYHLDDKKEMTLNVGIGYRLRDAAQVILGMDYKQFRAGFAYDLSISDLADAGTPQSFELGVSYIAKIFKKPVVKPVIFCPRF